MIRAMTPEDWPAVKAIYEEGIKTRVATFETEVPPYKKWDQTKLPYGRLVYVDGNNRVLGWTALSTASDRCVYAGVAELMVYVSEKARGQGVGTKLLKDLIGVSEDNGIWTLQAGIDTLNTASVRLHEKVGFRVVGVREKLGKMDNDWHDIYLLERRSEKFQD